ncbi:hypothetical protein B0A52_02669 [Exophiala mesophila]|uniref:Uncharacterized protein n=1 Tax=Exophiala mesophila TaxID=212818 RepID=A0A438NDR3_EXOME|nr:hypothetical protein B0A52_02669 [Exophiala mesophila]
MSNYPICEVDTPDPWMLEFQGKFYLTFTLGNRVEIWSSRSMEDFRGCEKTLAWNPALGSPWSADIWAPELHYVDGRWYVYFCAAQPGKGNASHRTLMLRSESQDPMDGSPGTWQFLGPVRGLPNHWHIDATVFRPVPNELYICYSGWPLGDHSDTQQDLFIMQMANPEEAVPGTLTCVSRAQLPWERPDGGRRGVNEGPTWLSIPGFQGFVYSANGSWTSDYQLGLVRWTGGNPRDERSWQKRHTPLLVSDRAVGGPFGPGHASFILSPYSNNMIFCIYHATERHGEGWNNRKARVLCLRPDNFHPSAPPVCCANGLQMNPPTGPRPAARQRNVFEQQQQYKQQQQQQQQQEKGFMGRVMRKLNNF